MAAPTTLRIVDPEPDMPALDPAVITLDDDADESDTKVQDGIAITENADGSSTVDFNPSLGKDRSKDEGDFYRNLADEITDQLTDIANEINTGIEYDLQSRKDEMDIRARGIILLGLKQDEPRGDVGSGSAPLEGMSSVRHPLLLEATIRSQATARGELLPAGGPVKVRNDATQPPAPPPGTPPPIGHNGGPAIEGQALDELGEALQKDFNHYLTVTAKEYIPDTDRMLFRVPLMGDGYKKVYNCPLRRRPVSESVDAENLIVSNAATALADCGRVTHQIKMRPSVLRRMQILKAYRDVPLQKPVAEAPDPVAQAKADIHGIKPQQMRPEDTDYTIYECYCELDIDEFAPKQFKGKELPLPYVVTLEKESKQVLAVRRNWNENDEQCLSKQFFVQFPYIRGLGFYGLGLVHILGNTTVALTAILRIMVDNGMFSNFPGFLYAKQAGRQLTNQFRVAPGSGVPIDIGAGGKLSDVVMPLPYKETGAALFNLYKDMEDSGQRLGQMAEINVGEGKQEVPVGTTMALIEQATKIMDSVHKRLHAAQAEELGLLKERFREDPEAFWRHNKKPAKKWTIDQFKEALEQRELVPVADPNNPTSLHRIAKATIIDTLVQKYPQLMNAANSLRRILRTADIDAEGLLNDQPAAPPPDPRFAAITAKAQAQERMAQIAEAKVKVQLMIAQADMVDKGKEREFKQQMEQFQLQLESMRIQQEMVIHAKDSEMAQWQAHQDMQTKAVQAAHGMVMDHAQHQQELGLGHARGAHEIAMDGARHQADMTRGQQQHDQKLQHADQTHEQRLEQIRATAAAKPKTESK